MPNLFKFGFGGGSLASVPVLGTDFTWTGGDGTLQLIDDGEENWRIKFLSSGTFTPLVDMVVDVFCLGGGGGTGGRRCGAGGAGYTTTVQSVALTAGTAYTVTVGAAGKNSDVAAGDGTDGGSTSAFGVKAQGGFGTAQGSSSSARIAGGNGGSGGGAIGSTSTYSQMPGGADGSDGEVYSDYVAGTGQGTTTREFGEAAGTLYAEGGGSQLTYTVPNSGNGGGRSGTAFAVGVEPADGIVVIRKHKEAA